MKQIDVIKPITQADAVFNICKMKTHLYMHVTGAVKNHFGIIPGLSKVGFHAKLFNKERFADMLLDLSLYAAPRLTIMDAVLAMEGEGPGASGTPRHVGLLLASTSDLALDVVVGEIMGLPHDHNPVLMAAERREVSPCKIEDVNVIGEELSGIKISDYKFPSTVKGFSKTVEKNSVVRNFLKSALTKYPVVAKGRCIGCGMCATACPQKMITMITQKGKKRADINLKDCIRCYCCHELCPHKAIDIKSKFIHKALKI
jgi:ferredoxin